MKVHSTRIAKIESRYDHIFSVDVAGHELP